MRVTVLFKVLIATFISLVFVQISLAKVNCDQLAKSYEKAADEIHKKIEMERTNDSVPGLTYAAYTKDCVLFSQSSGSGDLDGKMLLDPQQSLFRIASVSKLFVTVAIAQLIEKGYFSYNSRLMNLNRVDFVRFLKANESRQRLRQWRKIRINHLMSHQAGISKDLPGVLVFWNSSSIEDNAYPTMNELFEGVSKTEFLFEPGRVEVGMKYSNLAMNMLARVVEAYNPEGLPFQSYVKKYILNPLGMNHTFYNLRGKIRDELTFSHKALDENKMREVLPKVYRVGSYDGSIGVATTSMDMSLFGQQLLRMFLYNKSKLLDNPRMIRNYFWPKSSYSQRLSWASGPLWQVLPGKTLNDSLWVGHTGTGYGERAFLMFAPERNLGIAINFNAPDVNREKYANIIADALKVEKLKLRRPAQQILAGVRSFHQNTKDVKKDVPDYKVDPKKFERFLGDYYSDGRGVMKVELDKDGHLTLAGQKLFIDDMNAGLFRFPKSGGILFAAEPVQFLFDANGEVESVRIAQVKLLEKLN